MHTDVCLVANVFRKGCATTKCKLAKKQRYGVHSLLYLTRVNLTKVCIHESGTHTLLPVVDWVSHLLWPAYKWHCGNHHLHTSACLNEILRTWFGDFGPYRACKNSDEYRKARELGIWLIYCDTYLISLQKFYVLWPTACYIGSFCDQMYQNEFISNQDWLILALFGYTTHIQCFYWLFHYIYHLWLSPVVWFSHSWLWHW